MKLEEQSICWERSYCRSPRQWRGPASISLELEGNETVLEIGCGNGKSVQGLLKARNVVALDFSETAVRSCKAHHPSTQTILAEAKALPFKDSSFDIVVASHLIGHGMEAERRQMAEEASRVLMPGGRMLVRVFGVDDLRSEKGKRVEERTLVRGNGILYHYFTKEELVSLFPTLIVDGLSTIDEERRFGKERVRRSMLELRLSKAGSP